MKRFVKMGLASVCIVLAATNCTWDDIEPADSGSANLIFNFVSTKAAVPDPDSFVLEVIGSQGDTFYSGPFGDRPQSLAVKPGSYEVRLFSEFDAPAFNSPQYGDVVNVTVKKKETVTVNLNCTLVNSGIYLTFSDTFRQEYGNSPIILSQNGKEVEYPFSKSDVAYFNPGRVFVLYNGEVMLYKELLGGQIRHLNLDAVYSSAEVGFTVRIDTDAPVIEDEHTMEPQPFGVEEAKLFDDGLTASVEGYIVGAVKSSKFIAAGTSGFDVTSNIVISSVTNPASLSDCIPVELKGAFKNELNLVEHPELSGRKVVVKGSVMPYFGVRGLKNVTKYILQ